MGSEPRGVIPACGPHSVNAKRPRRVRDLTTTPANVVTLTWQRQISHDRLVDTIDLVSLQSYTAPRRAEYQRGAWERIAVPDRIMGGI